MEAGTVEPSPGNDRAAQSGSLSAESAESAEPEVQPGNLAAESAAEPERLLSESESARVRPPSGRWGPIPDPVRGVARYLFINLSTILWGILFFVLNRTTVLGREKVPQERNTLLLANHQSMIDSFLVGMAVYYPYTWWKPFLIPWNPAAEENFFDTWPKRILADLWKCIPVREGRRDLKALHRMIQALRRGTMTLFPEGTRTRDGSISDGRPGAGLLILANQPNVVPVTIDGMRDVLPVGSRIPRLFKHVYVMYGDPIDCTDFGGRPRSKDTAQEVVDRVVNVLRGQQREIRRLRAGGAAAEEPQAGSDTG